MSTSTFHKPPSATTQSEAGQSCPYLDTINRSLLDFDFEHSCSITLQSGPHVYCCLVCGKFFRGRGPSTPAHTHSVDEGHFVYVHLSKGSFHCLPDDYEIIDPSLNDISASLHPTFTDEQIRIMDSQKGLARDLFGRRYLPGYVGLNNLSKTDYINATVQALAHVRPLRDYFLRLGRHRDDGVATDPKSTNDAETKQVAATTTTTTNAKKRKATSSVVRPHSELATRFGELVRKMWSDRRFKSNVDPHMLVQAVSVASGKRYRVGRQAEAGEFVAWMLHQLHIGLGGDAGGNSSKKKKKKSKSMTKNKKSSIIQEVFQGEVEVVTRRRRRRRHRDGTNENDEGLGDDDNYDDRAGSEDEGAFEEKEQERERKKRGLESRDGVNPDSISNVEETTSTTNFLQLTLDIPEKPLFKDDEGGLVIPQEPLVSVLKKFDGMTFSDALSPSGEAIKRRYRLKRLPNYLVLHLSRFQRNGFAVEKNPTIVPFPVKNLDLTRYVFPSNGEREKPPSEEEVKAMSVKDLKKLLSRHGRSDLADSCIEKSDLVKAVVDFVTKSLPDLLADKYDLVANITHHTPAEVGREGRRDPLEDGSYRCHVQHGASGQWYEMQDLHVQETMPQLIGLSESYVLIFEKKGLYSG